MSDQDSCFFFLFLSKDKGFGATTLGGMLVSAVGAVYGRVFFSPRAEGEADAVAQRRKAKRFGWFSGLVSVPVLAGLMMGQGAEFDVAAIMSLFGGTAAGLLGWVLAAFWMNSASNQSWPATEAVLFDRGDR